MDLNAEQKRIATQGPKGHNLIKGVAGSGKTSVGLFRVHFLLNNYCYGKDDAILLATYNRTLIQYMEYLYKKMDNFQNGEFQSLFKAENKKVDIKTVDSAMYPYFEAYAKNHKVRYKTGIPQQLHYEIVSEGITRLGKKFPGVNILNQKNTVFLLQEINWIKDCLYLEEEEYQEADRKGMTKSNTEGKLQRLQKNSKTRKAIFELMRFYDDRLQKKGYICFGDFRLMALKQARKEAKTKYTHIIIDESQDLTRSQLLFLKAVYNEKEYSSLTFIADPAQNIYPQSWIASGHSFASIGFSMQGRSHSLSKNFRTTTQISRAAYSLIENCVEIVEDEHFVKPALIDKQGVYPVFKRFSNEQNQAAFIEREIIKQKDLHSIGEMVVLARFKSQLERLRSALSAKGINCCYFSDKNVSFDTNSLKLVTLHSIKGLEFPVVFIAGLNENAIPYLPDSHEEGQHDDEIKERKLFYVGMTRATETLYLISSERPSRFLRDISPCFLRVDSEMRMRRFYNVPIDDFHYRDKLPNIHGAEEKIRQWVISELINVYGFPTDCISVEYPVKAFSQTGYADIAVKINRDNREVPLILIETKRKGQNFNEAVKQLKSYLDHCPLCVYGAVTDGSYVVVIDRDFNKITDFPVFKSKWGLSSAIRMNYKNFKTGQKAVFCFDPNEPSSIEVECQGESELLDRNHLEKIPVYGRIQAGIPIHMNTESGREVYLPCEWVKGAEHFALKVRGDSMTGAEINDGDIVVIRKQDTAQNLDIVAVALGDEGTLKRFSKMGNSALLLAENPDYDPILLEDEQVNILGRAVGILKG